MVYADETKLSCKNLDAYRSFLTRISKIGKQYIRKNDTWMAQQKANVPAFDGPMPGRHIIRDPFLQNGDAYIPNEPYCMAAIPDIVGVLDDIKENHSDLRKLAKYIHRSNDDNHFAKIILSLGEQSILVAETLLSLIEASKNKLTTKEIDTLMTSVHRQSDLIDTFSGELMEDKDVPWTKFEVNELIDIRNGGHLDLVYNGFPTRIVKPLFALAGALRKDTPVATEAHYRIFEMSSEQNARLGKLQIHAIYPCLSGSKLIIDAIHEYVVVGYNKNY